MTKRITPAAVFAAAVAEIGSQAKVASVLKVSQPTVHNWLRLRRECPAEHAAAVEQATGGKFTRSMLRPDLWPAAEERAA